MSNALASMTDRQTVGVSIALSGVATAFLVWLIYFNTGSAEPVAWAKHLPAVNAGLNSVSALCVAAGIWAIYSGRRNLHIGCMVSATVASALFLIFYIIYHAVQGDTKFVGTGWIRPVYFFILISHIVLSIVVLPMVFATLLFAARGRYERHRAIARWTYPIWLYVSVTGVLVFVFLRFLNR